MAFVSDVTVDSSIIWHRRRAGGLGGSNSINGLMVGKSPLSVILSSARVKKIIRSEYRISISNPGRESGRADDGPIGRCSLFEFTTFSSIRSPPAMQLTASLTRLMP